VRTTGKGVIQGYCGVSAVDVNHQIVIDVQAHGTSSEQELLLPVVEATAPYRTDETVITADAGYHSEANLKQLAANKVEAFTPDNGYRQRDERYAGQEARVGCNRREPYCTDGVCNSCGAIRFAITPYTGSLGS
jgi:hypothetical protein